MNIPKFFPDNDSSISNWESYRRKEILKLFEEHVYGITPIFNFKSNYYISEYIKLNNNIIRETITASFEYNNNICSFNFRIFREDNDNIYPGIIMINPFSRNESVQYDGRENDHMPYEYIVKNGFVAVHADVDGICEDNKLTYNAGLGRLIPSSWGAIGMWAWATIRVVDYLYNCNYIDKSKISICGCSRAGKTALWASAQDARVYCTISNVSGCTGSALSRGKTGERISDITSQFPHWMCNNYKSYSNRESDLPVDQHMLLGLIAPRKLYISSAVEDHWADPKNELKSAILSSEIYNIYNVSGLIIDNNPIINKSYNLGEVAYHIREGKHGCNIIDWKNFIEFLKK